ncbi:unnamed protein product [Linum trigynum]|uniref:Uncharacterized protein n=1 Tax=Linum trigynum TaxID=586398 RepID=A0AAV2EE39_9ROSI
MLDFRHRIPTQVLVENIVASLPVLVSDLGDAAVVGLAEDGGRAYLITDQVNVVIGSEGGDASQGVPVENHSQWVRWVGQ